MEKKQRLLIIDDDEATGLCLQELLTLEGYQVEIRQDGRSGLAHVMQEHPDLVILDLMIPGMSGEQVLSEIRKNQLKTPVILVSAFNNLFDRVKGLNASHVHSKPFSSDDLLKTIRMLLIA